MKKLSALLVLTSLVILFIFSCQKDKSTTYPGGNSSYTSIRTTVTGIVLDESNAPLTGVTVTAYGQTTTTSQYGTFVLKNINVNKDRCVLQFTKAGFFNRSHGFIASGNTVNYVRIVLISNAATQTVSASAGGTVYLLDGSSVLFQHNSFVTANGMTYTGTVNIAIKHLSPDDANFGFMTPGGDLLGKDLNNKDVALYTYGMLGVVLTGNSGETLQLATGTTATLTMSIAAIQLSTAPATISLWYFDENTSLWKEEGTATKVGNNYVGTVAHFSWWNCDYGGPKSYLKGKVVDCNGVPVPNVVVSLNGYAEVTTDQNGEYNDWIPSGLTITIQMQVLASNNSGNVLSSQLENIPSLSPNQIYTVPDLIIPCPTRVAGSIHLCSGEITDGFVSLSNASFYCFQYTLNGVFNVVVPPNTQLLLYAANGSNNFYSQNITSLVPPNNLIAGNLLLCDSLNQNVTNNIFILNGTFFSNRAFNMSVANSTAAVMDTSGSTYIAIAEDGTALPNFTISDFYININDTVPGATSCNLSFFMSDGTNNYSTYSSNLPCNLIQVAAVGNKIKGEYYGVVVYTSLNGGSSTVGNISGSFDVVRTQ